MHPSRRDVLRAVAASFAGLPVGCRASQAKREGGRVVVRFWYAYGDKVRQVLLGLVERYNASQDRVFVRAVHQGDYFEALAKLRTAIVAGSAPALSHVVLEVLPYLASAGALEALDDYEGAREAPFVEALTQAGSFADGLVDGRSADRLVGGRSAADGGRRPLVAIPFNRSTPIAFANARLLDAAGVAPPDTWEGLVAAAHRLSGRTAGGDERWGFEVPISWWYWVALVGQAGGRLADDEGRLTLGGAAGEEALRFWQRLVREERVMRPPPGRDYQSWQSTNESFLRGRVAMMWSSTAYVRYLEDNASFPVVAAPLPRHRRASVPTGGTMFVLVRSAPEDEKRAAWDFVRWMCRDEQAMAWSIATGYMPITRTAVARLEAEGWYRRHPNDRVAYDQLGAVDPWPWSPPLFRVERDVVEPRLEDAVLTGRDARAVLDEARADAARPA